VSDDPCPFCEPREAFAETKFFRALYDLFPVNEGHVLVVLKRHEPSFLALTEEEWGDLFHGIHAACDHIRERFGVDGFNIGVNVGEAAGQTVPHVHVHVIPRYAGDCSDPGGGVRKVKTPLVKYPAPR